MAKSKFEIQRECEICKKPFFAKTVYSIFCSKKCSSAAYRQKKQKEKRAEEQKLLASKIPSDRSFISVTEAVALYGVSRDTIYRLIKKGKLPIINMGERLTRISRNHIEEIFPTVASQNKQIEDVQPVYMFDPSNCYTIGEISELYGVSGKTVYNAIRNFKITVTQRGRFVYVSKLEIEKIFGKAPD